MLTEEEKKQRRKDSQKRYRESHKEQIKAYSIEYNKKYYAEHKEENRESRNKESLERYYKNREKILSKRRNDYIEKKDILLERNKEWKKEHPNYMKEYRESHKDEISEYNKNFYTVYKSTKIGRASNLLKSYRQRDRKNKLGECTLTKEWIVDNIFTKSCVYCGKEGWKVIGCDRIDNSKPHTEDNVVPCCQSCNSKKGQMTYEEYINKMLRLVS